MQDVRSVLKIVITLAVMEGNVVLMDVVAIVALVMRALIVIVRANVCRLPPKVCNLHFFFIFLSSSLLNLICLYAGVCSNPVQLFEGATNLTGVHYFTGNNSEGYHRHVIHCNLASTSPEYVYTFTVPGNHIIKRRRKKASK